MRPDSGIGIKPMSRVGTKRLVRMAIKYAIDNNRKSVTLVHKGNIMKFTEGAFRDWGYELAKSEFRDHIVTEDEVVGRRQQDGKVVIKDRIADSVFQQILTRTGRVRRDRDAEPERRLPLGRLRGAGRRPRHRARRQHRRRDRGLRGDARHGAEVRRQGRHQPELGDAVGRDDVPLPGLDRGRRQPSSRPSSKTIKQKKVTYDLARQMQGATEVKTSEFADAIIANMA